MSTLPKALVETRSTKFEEIWLYQRKMIISVMRVIYPIAFGYTRPFLYFSCCYLTFPFYFAHAPDVISLPFDVCVFFLNSL